MLEEENIDQLKMTDWQNAIYRHSTRIDPSFPLVDYCLKLYTTGINRKYFHLCSPCPSVHVHFALLDPMCVHFTVSQIHAYVHGSQDDPPHQAVSQRAADSQRIPFPARLGPAVDSVQQSSTYRPTCQDASSALTGQTREKA